MTMEEEPEDRKEALAQLEARRATEEAVVAGMKAATKAGKKLPPLESTVRVFICPQEPNTRYLVKAGTVVSFRDPNSPTGKRDAQREGDIWAEFIEGVLATDDPEVIAWCEAHSVDEALHQVYHRERGQNIRNCPIKPGLCCDATHPMAEIWADMKSAQMPLANREATMPPGTEVDKLLTGGIPAHQAGGAGDKLVTSAKARAKAEKQARGEE
jgi:hypothetical protein